MRALTNRWVGAGMAPGTAVAASWRADRPVPAPPGPLDPERGQQAFAGAAADLLEHLGSGLVGAVAVHGGANSHAAIVARSVGLPLVAGVHPEILDLPDDTPLLVDADAGVVLADPPDAEIARADRAAARDN